MNIIVLIKQVPDPTLPVSFRPDGTIEREKAKLVTNPYDKNALEAALQIKDREEARITVISMGPSQAIEAVREALAMGADEGILLCDKRLAGSDTLATSYALSQAIKKIGKFDLILCGMETTDGNTGQVGPEVAEHLGIPHFTYIEGFDIEADTVIAKRLIEGGYENVKTKLPALLTITSTANEPRYPSILGIRAAMKKTILTWTIDDIEADETKVGLIGSPTRVIKIGPPERRKAAGIIFRDADIGKLVESFLNKLKEDGIKLKW